MSTAENWNTLYGQVASEVERRSSVAGGTQNFYWTQGLKEVQEWMLKLDPSTRPAASAAPRDDRVVHGTGVDSQGPYEVVRYTRSKKIWVEHSPQRRRQVSLAEAVKATQEHLPGQTGGSAFDRAYLKSGLA